MLFNEPKLLKSLLEHQALERARGFSALQRAEIAEILPRLTHLPRSQRSFSALQRAEIAEIHPAPRAKPANGRVSVLFNEPKLLK